MSLIARTQVKTIIGDFNIAADFFPALEHELERIVKNAVARAKQNNRRTLMARDV